MSARHGGRCTCPYCTPAPVATTPAVPEPIELPAEPTPIRVHTADRAPFDCVLHPDGTLTAVFNGEQRRNFMTFADMRERAWAQARIEFNPPPPVEGPEPEQAPPVVQEALAL